MDKITFLGAGSTVFAKNVLGDCITTDAMREFEYALYDIDHQRLEESYMMLSNINRNSNDGKAKVVKYADRLDALRGAKYVINCIQVGGYDPVRLQTLKFPKIWTAPDDRRYARHRWNVPGTAHHPCNVGLCERHGEGLS